MLRILFPTDVAIYFVWFEKEGVSVAVLLFECLCSVAQTNGGVIKNTLAPVFRLLLSWSPWLFWEVFSCDDHERQSRAEGVALVRPVLKY